MNFSNICENRVLDLSTEHSKLFNMKAKNTSIAKGRQPLTEKMEISKNDGCTIRKRSGKSRASLAKSIKGTDCYKSLSKDKKNVVLSPQRLAANARERKRTRSVHDALLRLKCVIPLPDDVPNVKLSKLEILRLATYYIQHLSWVLKESSVVDFNPLNILEKIKERNLKEQPQDIFSHFTTFSDDSFDAKSEPGR